MTSFDGCGNRQLTLTLPLRSLPRARLISVARVIRTWRFARFVNYSYRFSNTIEYDRMMKEQFRSRFNGASRPLSSGKSSSCFRACIIILLDFTRDGFGPFSRSHSDVSAFITSLMALQFRRARNMKYRAASAVSTAYVGWNPYRVVSGMHVSLKCREGEGERRVMSRKSGAFVPARGEIYASEREFSRIASFKAHTWTVCGGCGGRGGEEGCRSFSARGSRNRNYATERLRRPRAAYFLYVPQRGGQGRGALSVHICERIRAQSMARGNRET